MRQHLPGSDFAGYLIEGLAGRGGMGEVYRARDTRLDRPVALKLLSSTFADDAGFRERLLRESRLAAGIDHPNVIPIYEAGEADGSLFIAMRYVEGTDLKALLRREGALAAQRAMAIVRQVADALDAAHARGLVHRDVKPSNILIDEQDGREHVYLADFGLTQSANDRAIADGQLMGTLEYVAPEQIRGDPVDGRTDVYALGCLVFEALTGTLPFPEGSDVALIYAHLEQEPPPPSERRPGIPTAVDAVVGRAMAKDPDERPATCRQLVTELDAALGLRPGRRDLLPVIGVVATLVAIVIGVAVVVLTRGAGLAAAAPSGSVVRVDPATNTVTGRFTLGPHPGEVAAGAGRVWVVSPQGQALWQVDPSSSEVRLVSAVGAPRGVAILGSTVYVISDGPGFDRGSLTPYDAVTGQRRRGIASLDCSVAAAPGYGIATSACPLAARFDDRFGALRMAWQTLIPYAEPRTTETSRNCQCDMSVGFGDLWIAGDPTDGRVWRLDRAGRIVATIALPFGARSIAAGEGGVWVTGPIDDRVVRIDPRTNRVTDDLAAGRGASGVAAGAGGVWVADALDGTLLRIDPTTRRPVVTIPLGGRPTEVTVGDSDVWVTVDGA